MVKCLQVFYNGELICRPIDPIAWNLDKFISVAVQFVEQDNIAKLKKKQLVKTVVAHINLAREKISQFKTEGMLDYVVWGMSVLILVNIGAIHTDAENGFQEVEIDEEDAHTVISRKKILQRQQEVEPLTNY